MKKIFKSSIFAMMMVLILGSLAYAYGGHYGLNLTGKTVEISGTIQAIQVSFPRLEMKVDVNGKIVDVELGPIGQYDYKDFQVGNSITLTGEYVWENVFVPYSIKVNEKTYELRDDDGRPLWAGKGRPLWAGKGFDGRGYHNRRWPRLP